ncbi:uncharacterized protein [Ptychodera flava]|uniref:uncharacterized protein isoform X2 n=1 Tax=Ptychodera flava TaxID=63121 RepID=UPI003969C429
MNPTPPEPPPPGGGSSLGGKSKAKKVMFYKSGDTNFAGLQLAVSQRKYRTIDTLLNELSGKVSLPFGVRNIYTPGGIHGIREVDQLEDGRAYMLSSTKKPKPLDLSKVSKPKAWHNARILTPNQARFLAVRRRSASLPDGRGLPSGDSPGAASAPPPPFKRPKKICVCKNGEPDIKHLMLLNRRSAHSFEQLLQDISDMFRMQVALLYTGDGQKVESLSAIFNWPDTTFVAAGREKFKPKHYGDVPVRPPLKPKTKPKRDTEQKPARRSKGKYKVLVKTNPNPSAGTDAVISLTVYGMRGNSGPLELGGGDGKTFLPGNTDEFTITAGDLGQVYKVRVSQDDSTEFSAWLCDEVILKDIHTGEELKFHCNKWLSKEDDDGETCREMSVLRHGEPLYPLWQYEVATVTGDYWNAGTAANVFITMYGERGDTGPRHLHRAKRSQKFQKGQTDIFSVEAVSLGSLQKLTIGNDSTEPGQGWYLERVVVRESQDSQIEYTFPCQRWLDEGEDDAKTVRELFVDNKPRRGSEREMWELEKWKYNKGNQIILYCKGTGKPVRIKADATVDALGDINGKDPFTHFEVHKRKTNIRVLSSVINPSYHLAVDHSKVLGQGKGGAYCEFRVHVQQDRSVTLESVKTPGQYVTFLTNGRTGDTRGHGTGPARQFVTYMKGMFRDEGIIVLHTSKIQVFVTNAKGECRADGRRSQRAYWKIHKVDEGGIRMLESEAYPNTFLRIKEGQCDCQGTGDADCHFIIKRAKDKGFISLQSAKSRGLYVGFTPDGAARPTVDTGERNVRLYPEIIQFGVEKERFDNEVDMGPVPYLTVDPALGPEPSPTLLYQRLEIIEEEGSSRFPSATGSPFILPPKSPTPTPGAHSEPLSPSPTLKVPTPPRIPTPPVSPKPQRGRKKGTDQIPSPIPESPLVIGNQKPSKDGEWKIWLKSGKKGTKLPITVIAYGKKGTSDLLTIGKEGEVLQSGGEEEFVVNLSGVSDMYKIRLGLTDKHAASESWHLNQVRMQDMTSNEQLKFKVQRWLSRSEDDGDTLRELAVVRPQKKPLPTFKYFIHVYTGDEPGADTDANVYICIYGDRGDTGKRLLHRSDNKELFQQGQVDCFELEAVSLSKLNKVVISHDGKGPGAGWFCQSVVIRDKKDAKKEFVFPCNKWLDEGLDDKKIERELLLKEEREIQPNDWLVWVTTGREGSSSTTSKVMLFAYGSKGPSEGLVLGSGKDGYFYPGVTDEFKVNLGSIGDLFKVRIGHNNADDEPSWYLEKVRMRDMNDGTLHSLDVNRWLSREHDDLDVWRELPIALPGKEPLPVMKYVVQVFTGDFDKAKTSATVFINLHGKRADCGKRVLFKSKNHDEKFEINQMDEFEIEAVHLGDVKKVLIGHDGKTPGQGWYLDKVIVKESQDSNKEMFFPCRKWFDKGLEDKKIERELSAEKPVGEYSVTFVTGDDSMSRGDAKVYFEVYGDNGYTDPFVLGATKKEYFSPGGVDRFEVNVGDIGDIYKIRVSHRDEQKWDGWYLKEVKMLDRLKKQTVVYKCDRWMSRTEDDLDIVREMPTERPGKDSLPLVKYHIEVYTGSMANADTKANVYMTIFGKNGDCGRRILYKSKNNEEKFQRDQKDIFEIEAVHLMDLRKVVIGHDGMIGGEGWFLEKIIIKEHPDSDEEWYFLCRKWLDSSKNGRKIERELKPSKPEYEWTVWITTGSRSSNRNGAPAHIVVYGDKGKSDMIPLGDARPKTLMAGQTDEFEIQTNKVGKVYKIRIGYEDDDKWDGWHVEEVRLKERASKDILTFPVDRWMSRSEDDSDIVRELPALRGNKGPLTVFRYHVQVYTSDLDNADTDSKVFVTIYGKRGDTGERALYTSKNNREKFQRGQMDIFEIEAVDLDDIKSVVLRHDGREPGQGWHVDHVVVKETEDAEKEWYFPCNRWFDVSKDDRKIERELTTGKPDIPKPPTPEPSDGWQLWIETANDSKPPRGAVAYITVYGQKNKSDRIPLSGPDSFEPGKTDKFDINFESKLGELYKVRVEHDDKDKWQGWHVHEVRMHDNKTNDDYAYTVDRWLSRNEDDLDIVREIPLVRDGIDPLPVLKYYIEVFTGSIEKADTSANVYMTIFGKKGDSGKRTLYKSKNHEEKFQREQKDIFEIEAVHLMDLKKIVIGHDGKVAGKGWFLSKVIIKESEDAEKEFYFPCFKWLDAEQDDKKIEREIKVGKPENEWTVWINTADDSKSRNDVPAHMVVYGSKGKSDPIPLGNARLNTINPGTVDEFEINTGKVGEIYKIRIGYEDDKKWEGWHLREVKMRDRYSHEELVFDFDRWMSRTEDDLDIVRELPAERAGKDTLPVLKYYVQVYTDEDEKASTDAKIYMEIHGERGDTGRRVLYKSKNNEEKFQKGQLDIFEIEAVHLGQLKKVIIGHDKNIAGQGWQLDKVVIKESEEAEKEWFFPCKRWLDAGRDDNKIERTLKPSSPDGEWTLWITTAEDSKPRNESSVHLVVYGNKDKTEPIPLGAGKPEYFEPNTTNEIDINVGSIGKIYKIRIGHDHGDSWVGWHLDQVKMKERKSKEELVFSFDRWMSKTEDDLDVVRELPVIRDGEDPLPVMKYIVQVYTGMEENAETEATCHLCIYGERGDTGNRVLFKSKTNDNKFQKGQKDIFEIEAVHLGDLKKVVVGHDGKKAGEGWFVEKVLIKESEDTDKGWYFPCDRWLDVGKDDRKIERELKPSIPDNEWTLWITTAEDSKPRNENSVHLVVYGEKDKTEPIRLGVGKPEYFEPNTTDEMDIDVGKIGKIYKIRIGHDHGDSWDGWHLDQVKMKARKSGEILEYKFDRWMSRDDDDLEIVRELPAIREGEDVLPVIKYYVVVQTGDEENAETEATCYLCIYGERGDTGNRVLFKSKTNDNKFQKGQKDIFEIEAVHLGDLKKVVVGHDGKAAGQGWYLSHVIVKESEDDEKEVFFKNDRWLDAGQDDKAIERELYPGQPEGEWDVTIVTAEDSTPAMDATVYLVVYGDGGKSDPIPLGQDGTEYFEPGKTDLFERIKISVGKIYKIRIGHDDTDKWEGWHLQEVHMKERSTEEKLTFKFDRWMSRTQDDLDILREMPAIREEEDELPVIKYYVVVQTGDEENAETEATCYLCIYGERGDTGNRVLFKSKTNDNKFQKGQKDIFEIEAVHLGDLKKVVVGHDGKEADQGWYLSHVMVKESEDAEKEVFFKNDRWLDAGQDDKAIERELYPGQPEGEWDVTIVTAEDSTPAMDATVYLVVYGDGGKSDPIPLGQDGTEYFEPGKTDLFERIKISVGKIYKIRIGHDDTDKWEGWHLQEVHMKERSTEEKLTFKFDRWMSRTQDDLDILREMPAIREEEEQLPVFRYFISVFTGEEENAETEATMYMCIYGERGDTGNRVLFKSLNNDEKFQKGQVDMFEIEAVSLGQLEKVVVGHDGKEDGQGWFCEKVIIKEAQDSEAEFHFPCNRWLDAGQDDQAIERELLLGKPPEGEWKVVITTHKDSIPPPTDSSAYLVVYGDKGKSDSINIGGEPALQPNNLDEFDITLDAIGEMYKIRVEHQDKDNWEGWYLEEVEMTDKASGEKLTYSFNRWLSRTRDDYDIARELPTIREGQETLPVLRYNVLVYTGDRWAANTDAPVHVTLYGERGDSGQRRLFYSKNNDEMFQRDQMDSFGLEAVSLGELTMIEVSQDGIGYGAGVFIQKILIRDSEEAESEYVFWCDQWLDDHVGDRKTCRQLPLLGVRPVEQEKEEDGKKKKESKGKWTVSVKVSKKDDVLPTSQLSLVVCGAEGQSPLLPLNTKKLMDDKKIDVKVGRIGEIYKIRIQHDNNGENPAWHINKVEMTDKDSQEQLEFTVNSVLSKDEGQCDIYKEAPLLRAGKDPMPLITYILEVKTSEEENSGTNGNVFVTLHGETGDSGKRQLMRKKPKKDEKKDEKKDGQGDEDEAQKDSKDESEKDEKFFQQGQTDTFLVEAVSLGQLEKITVSIASAGEDDAWHLDQITVMESEMAKTQYVFQSQEWFGKAEDDGNIFVEREILGSEMPVPPPEKTDDEEKKDTEEDSDEKEKTEDEEDDGESNSKGKWHVWVRTGKELSMGTTAQVCMVVYGSRGCTEPIPLRKETEEEETHEHEAPSEDDKDGNLKLKPGSTEEFDVDVGDIGPLYKIRVFHDNTGESPSWFLEKIKMKDSDTNQEFHFFAKKWLREADESSKTKEEGENAGNPGDGDAGRSADEEKKDDEESEEKEEDDIMVELPAIRPDIPPPPVYTYEVAVHTGDRGASATDTVDVYMTVYGETKYGDTGRRNLKKSTNNEVKFQQGQTDIFYITSVDVVKPQSIVIGHNEEGYGAGWYIDKVTVKESKDAKTMYYFPCHRWLDTGVDDRKTERKLTLLGEMPVPLVDENDKGPKSEGFWNVTIVTSDEDDAGTKALVYLIVYGENAMSSKHELSDGSMNSQTFDPGNEDKIDINIGDIGKISKVRLFHNNTNPDPRWKVSKVKMEDQHTGEVLEFHFDCWIGEEDGDGTICKEVAAKREDEEPLQAIQYEVEVYTGDEEDSGTDASVFILVNGNKGDTGRRDLKKSQSENNQKFQKGQMDSFAFEAIDLGILESVFIGIDSEDVDKKWFLEKLVIKYSVNDDAKEILFDCKQWLGEEDTLLTLYPQANWKCSVETSQDHESNLNGAKVRLVAYEMRERISSHMSELMTLDDSVEDMFTPGKMDEFELDPGTTQLHQVYKIRVWLEEPQDADEEEAGDTGEKKSPSLHISNIVLKDDNSTELKFEVNKWLSKTEEDCMVLRELPAIKDNEEPLAVIPYHVTVYTAEDNKAETDSDVYITIFGERGDTGKRLLSKPNTDEKVFDKPGKVDEFTVEAVSLGSITQIVLWKSPGQAWFVEKVVIKEGISAQQETEFHCLELLGAEDLEAPAEQMFTVADVQESEKIAVPLPEGETPPESEGEWKVYITTGKEENAGTTAKVSLTAYGKDGVSETKVLGEDKEEKFQQGTTDELDVNLGKIGLIYKIRVELDDTEEDASWFLEKIKLKDVNTKEEFSYKPNCWLNKDEGVIKEIPAIWPEKKILRSIPYSVEVYTADKDNAGTDANVYITVYGEYGDTGKRRLDKPEEEDDEKNEGGAENEEREGDEQNKDKKFPQGKMKKFVLEAVDLGELSKAVIGHDGVDAEGGWFLNKAVIRNPESEKSWAFKCDQWLSDVEDDKLTEREILASEDTPDPIDGDYKVLVTTKDDENAGTTANVTIVVYGDQDKSDEIPLDGEDGAKLQQGATDEFDIHVDNIGKLYKVRVSHDNSGDNPSWYLDKIVLVDKVNQSEVSFPCEKWLSREQDDEEIVRELPATHEGEEPPEVMKYEVKVHTGDKFDGAGTSADVYINIHGEKGDTGKRELRKNLEGDDKFGHGKVDTFLIEAVQLGALQKVTIGHEGEGPGSGWYLDKVVVKESSDATEEHVFPCDRWLADDEDDNKTERDLEALPSGDGEGEPAPEESPADGDGNPNENNNNNNGDLAQEDAPMATDVPEAPTEEKPKDDSSEADDKKDESDDVGQEKSGDAEQEDDGEKEKEEKEETQEDNPNSNNNNNNEDGDGDGEKEGDDAEDEDKTEEKKDEEEEKDEKAAEEPEAENPNENNNNNNDGQDEEGDDGEKDGKDDEKKDEEEKDENSEESAADNPNENNNNNNDGQEEQDSAEVKDDEDEKTENEEKGDQDEKSDEAVAEGDEDDQDKKEDDNDDKNDEQQKDDYDDADVEKDKEEEEKKDEEDEAGTDEKFDVPENDA